MLFGANGQVYALLLFFWVGIPLTIVVTISLSQKPWKAKQEVSGVEPMQGADIATESNGATRDAEIAAERLASKVKVVAGVALIAIGVWIFLANFAVRGPASVLAIFGLPFFVVGFLPLVDGIRGLKR